MTAEDTLIVFAVTVVYGLGTCVGLLVVMPFFVSITRLRANYLPKAVSLTNVLNEGELESMENRSVLHSFLMRSRRATAKIGPVVDGVLPMIWRTKRLEGWRGLYQGTTIVASGVLVTYAATAIFLLTAVESWDDWNASSRVPFLAAICIELLQALVVLPFDVVLKRTMVHPRRLNWFAPVQSMSEVLSPAEFKQPWRLYRIPGLLSAMLLRVTFVSTLALAADRVFLPRVEPLVPAGPGQDEFEGPSSASTRATVAGFIAYLLFTMALQLLAVPFECILVRLAVQRPVTQQPLHVAYAHNAERPGPSPHSHQATVVPPEAAATTASEPTEPRPADAPAEHAEDEAAAASNEAPADAPNEAPDAAPDAPMLEHSADEEDALPMLTDTVPRVYTQPPRTKSPTSEPVIALRPCDDTLDEIESYYGATPVEPYMGFADCFRKMVAEEGYESLYRGLPFSMGFVFVATLGLLPVLIDAFSMFS
ncbi:hypothetical protein MOBT1_003251 [Malassezia obtusa]|uniref:Uncharacterized protein n=1 Tax=Malassezia obtusa TaxID=76774 RepID=A0AAF0E3V1_9BASI|nr:hypothetical protein MOBT1_003251 [Malassezia obtusa]